MDTGRRQSIVYTYVAYIYIYISEAGVAADGTLLAFGPKEMERES